MSDVTDTLAALLAVDAAFDLWDMPQSLALLTRSPSGELGTLTVPFPPDLWAGQDTALVLDVIAAAVVQGSPLPIPDDAPEDHTVDGLVLYTEGWQLSLAGLTSDELDSLDEWAAGRFPDHPRAKEVKTFTAVDIRGGRHAATLTRGHGTATTFEGVDVTGKAADGLTAILAAVAITAN
ncbi:hypothetical protein [Leifsonia sp. Leaf264]|uniref:hypothetical protein n=1 Tax=Leifsonia sp. Leaf264 TaxID=1736314 RepID=UPI0006FFB077|nr:hypothetical protein [Leifsonia sp. Leaf264]KQO98447.1 hypothetical protein ASF30_10320 [Leifsonia sp. Leaf264]